MSWIVPTVQTIHILCVAIIVTHSAMLDLRLMGVAGNSRSIARMTRDAMPWIWNALRVLAATGTILIIAEPARELTNAAFWLKMCLLAVGIALTVSIQRGVGRSDDYWDSSESRRRIARVVAAISILLWIFVASAGRWIGYVQHG
ncbi:MAG: hypothetical protein M3N82_00955 [Pseudomonadota bacterium]|nr:hypothetical protein [Pseudomonadota bacterium]